MKSLVRKSVFWLNIYLSNLGWKSLPGAMKPYPLISGVQADLILLNSPQNIVNSGKKIIAIERSAGFKQMHFYEFKFCKIKKR